MPAPVGDRRTTLVVGLAEVVGTKASGYFVQMGIIAVPYHLDERLEAFNAGRPIDREITAELPSAGLWQRMAVLYEQVAEAVAGQSELACVVSGDCTTSLGALAGLQRPGRDVGVVWFDAHADFHTDATTTSGYLGGMPLALAAGIGTLDPARGAGTATGGRVEDRARRRSGYRPGRAGLA